MEALSPVHTANLFLPLHNDLLRLLTGLNPEQWARQTVAKQWAVRDVVAHLLDCDLRVLSLRRDGAQIRPDKPIDSFESLLGFLNGLNADWTRAAQRLSPRVMTDLLGSTGPQV